MRNSAMNTSIGQQMTKDLLMRLHLARQLIPPLDDGQRSPGTSGSKDHQFARPLVQPGQRIEIDVLHRRQV